MRMGHFCFPLREMNGMFAFGCLGLRIFSGNSFKLKFAWVLSIDLAQNKVLLQFIHGWATSMCMG